MPRLVIRLLWMVFNIPVGEYAEDMIMTALGCGVTFGIDWYWLSLYLVVSLLCSSH